MFVSLYYKQVNNFALKNKCFKMIDFVLRSSQLANMITYVQSGLLYNKKKQRMYTCASESKTISYSTCDTYHKHQILFPKNNSHVLF